ncbi:MAG: thiamine-phosphate kinase [Candidatus Thorarchaeota archaeon]
MPSEREFLENIKHLVHGVKEAVLGFDEDASDIPLSIDQSIVINIDTFVRETDWLPNMTAAQVGRKTAVMTISDVVAKGAEPRVSMLSLCVPKTYPDKEAEELIRGFSQYCMKTGISFLGGDFGTAKDVILTGVALGFAPPSGIIPRRGTKEGDIIAVTGDFGLTTVAFEHLLGGKDLSPELRSDALAAAYNPHIHHHFVPALAKKKAVNASMDSSDGLGYTLHTMAKQSGLAFVIDSLPVPVEVTRFARENLLDELSVVMLGGEEFTLVLSIPPEKWEIAIDIATQQKVSLQSIGYAQKGKGVKYESEEGYLDVPSSGYDNVRGWD